MITYDRDPEHYIITDLGRIAAKYYISFKSIEIFNEHLKEKMSEALVIHILSKSTEVWHVSTQRRPKLTHASLL